MKTKRYLLILALTLLLLLAGWIGTRSLLAEHSPAPNPTQPGTDDRLHQLVQARYESARKVFQIEAALVEGGKSTLLNLCEAARRVRDAAVELSPAKEDVMAAHAQYLQVIRRFEASVNKVADAGMAPPLDKELARYLRCDAEIALLKASR